MTLIAWNVQPDRVEIVTDGLTYTTDRDRIGRVSKITTLPHLDGAMTSNGSTSINLFAGALLHAHPFDTFDELLDAAPALLAPLREDLTEAGSDPDLGAVFLFGWSPREGRFVGANFAAYLCFAREYDLVDEAGYGCSPSHDIPLPDPRPSTAGDWVTFAQAVRDDLWALPDADRMAIGGDLIHTELTLGRQVQQRLHTFDDTHVSKRAMD